jgi:hypothetical protein
MNQPGMDQSLFKGMVQTATNLIFRSTPNGLLQQERTQYRYAQFSNQQRLERRTDEKPLAPQNQGQFMLSSP